MASVLRMGLALDNQQIEDLTDKSTQIMRVLDAPIYRKRAQGLTSANIKHSLQPLRTATKGKKMSLAAPISMIVEQAIPAFGLGQGKKTVQGLTNNVMLEMALPASYDSTAASDTGSNSNTRLCSNGTTLEDALDQVQQGRLLYEQCVPWSSPSGLKRPAGACQRHCASGPGGSFKWSKLQTIADAKEAIVYSPPNSIPTELSVEAQAVLVVGWNDAEEWWLVQNSWGPWPGGSRPGFIKVKYGSSGLMTPGYMYSLSWFGPGAKPMTLNPAYLKPDPFNKRCSWYSAQPGDTLAGVWRASGVKTLQQLMVANTDTMLIDGSRLTGKRVHICK